MNTLKEITTSEKANRDFWTGQARLCLCMYRVRKAEGDSRAAKVYRTGFLANMSHRRARHMLECR